MSRLERDDAALEAEIARLPDLGHDELRKRWKLLFGRPAPKSLRRKFMARAVAYQMQVAAYGGLTAATKRRGSARSPLRLAMAIGPAFSAGSKSNPARNSSGSGRTRPTP